MLFTRSLVIDSSLTPSATRARVRAFATSRDLPSLESFRRRQIVSWRLSQANEDSLFQPEYGESLDIDGARFIGLVEPLGSGSRVRGRVVLGPLVRIVMSIFMLAVVWVAVAAVGSNQEPATRILAIASTALGAALLMVNFGTRWTSRLAEVRLRQCLHERQARAVA